MKLHWRIRSFPELDHLTDGERQHLLLNHAKRATWSTVGISLFFSLMLGGTIDSFVHWSVSIPIVIVIAAFLYQFQIRRIRNNLQMQIIEAYRGQQLPICLKCGYDLRSIQASECPECGAGIHAKAKSPNRN